MHVADHVLRPHRHALTSAKRDPEPRHWRRSPQMSFQIFERGLRFIVHRLRILNRDTWRHAIARVALSRLASGSPRPLGIAYKLAISSTEQRRAVFARDHGRCAECGASKRRKVVVRWRVRRYRSADAIVRAALRRRCPTPIVISGCSVASIRCCPNALGSRSHHPALASTATSAARRAPPILGPGQSPDALPGVPQAKCAAEAMARAVRRRVPADDVGRISVSLMQPPAV